MAPYRAASTWARSSIPTAAAIGARVSRARVADEHRTRSGQTPVRLKWCASRPAASRPRGASCRSWSSTVGSSQVDLAWRRR